jgi:hypothetical protein
MKRSIGGTLRRWSAFALPVLLVAVAGCSDVAVTEPAFEALQTCTDSISPDLYKVVCPH